MTTYLSLDQWGILLAVGIACALVGFRVGARAPRNVVADLLAELHVVDARERGRSAAVLGARVVGTASVPLGMVHPVWQVDTSQLPVGGPSATTYRDLRSRDWPTTLADLEPVPVPDEDRPVEVDEDEYRESWYAVLPGRLAGWLRKVSAGLSARLRRDVWTHDGWEDRLDELAELRAGRHRAADEVEVAA